jgi:hypothetical protein
MEMKNTTPENKDTKLIKKEETNLGIGVNEIMKFALETQFTPPKDKKTDLGAITGKGAGSRFNTNKLRYDLVNPFAHRDMVDVISYGADKYLPRDWEKGLSWTSVIASLKRHIAAIEMCEDYDEESKKLHTAHAACNIHYLNAYYYMFPQGDDRPKKHINLPRIGLDIDGVLADFMKSWSDLYPDVSPAPSTWHADRNVRSRLAEMKEDGTLDDFYMAMKPLMKPTDMPFTPICYITSRPVDSEITDAWLMIQGFPNVPVHTVGLNETKSETAKKAGVEVFVDDNYENFQELNKAGIFTYLFDAPWNEHFNVGHMRIKTFSDMAFFRR